MLTSLSPLGLLLLSFRSTLLSQRFSIWLLLRFYSFHICLSIFINSFSSLFLFGRTLQLSFFLPLLPFHSSLFALRIPLFFFDCFSPSFDFFGFLFLLTLLSTLLLFLLTLFAPLLSQRFFIRFLLHP